jgi:hypothetical protein
MVRSIIVVIVGMAMASFLVFAMDEVNHAIFPPSAAILEASKTGDMAKVAKAVEQWLPTAPFGALVLIPVSWILATFIASFVAAWMARRATMIHALIVAAWPLLGTIMVLMMIPHPTWIAVAGLVGVPLAGLAAGLLAPRPPSHAQPQDMRTKNMAC